MPVSKITAQQFATQIGSGITTRDATVDTGFGPVPDIVINPVAKVLEQQNDRLRLVSLLVSLQNNTVFSDLDVDSFVFNEGILRSPGSQATGTVVFSRVTTPTVDITVQRGYPIATAPDESSGQSVTFITTEVKTLAVATASSFFNPTTTRYELPVPIIALVAGPAGLIGANRANRPLRPLVGFDSVNNPDPISQGGTSSQTNAQLLAQYQSAVAGRQLSTATGIRKYIQDKFPAVTDVKVVVGGDPLLTRAGTDAGAVDAFLISSSTTQQTDPLTFLGAGILHTVTLPPVVNISSVVIQLSSTTLTQGTDYIVSLDTSGISSSVRAADGIVFLSTSGSLPAIGSIINVTYTYSTLVRTLQADEANEDVHVLGRDLLFRAATEVDIVIVATLTAVSGFNPTTLASQAQTAILNFIDSLGLGQPIQGSDIQEVVRQISGIDNFVLTRLTRSTVATGTADINLASNEFPRTTLSNITITTA